MSNYNFDDLKLLKKDEKKLREKTKELNSINNSELTKLGIILNDIYILLFSYEVHTWKEYLNIITVSYHSAMSLINRYNFLISDLTKKEYLESLPEVLIKEVSNPNCEERLVEKVLKGEITTYQEFLIEQTSQNLKLIGMDSKFNYFDLDDKLRLFLRQKESELLYILKENHFKTAEILFNVKKKLDLISQNTFEKWYKNLGLKKTKVNNFISLYKLSMEIEENLKGKIKNLHPALAYAISKPATDKKIKDLVLSGEITTLKQLKEYKNRLINEKETNTTNSKTEKTLFS